MPASPSSTRPTDRGAGSTVRTRGCATTIFRSWSGARRPRSSPRRTCPDSSAADRWSRYGSSAWTAAGRSRCCTTSPPSCAGSLLLHAREQMPGGGRVQVKARVDRGRVLVTIRDAGKGMNEEDLERLFDPFSGVAGETALGLSVAWGVMSRLGGSLQAQSHPGEGTAFTLTFPLAAPPRRQPAPAPRGERRTRRILIVDDEQDNLEVLREVLEMEDQRVESVRSGPDAIGLFQPG